MFPWCSGYHIRLTRGRSPVRSRAETRPPSIPCGLVARIAGFHPAGPGSIPGTGGHLFCLFVRPPHLLHVHSHWEGGRGPPFFPSSSPATAMDEVAEWLRRWTANPMCSARVGSNPILVEATFFFARTLIPPALVSLSLSGSPSLTLTWTQQLYKEV